VGWDRFMTVSIIIVNIDFWGPRNRKAKFGCSTVMLRFEQRPPPSRDRQIDRPCEIRTHAVNESTWIQSIQVATTIFLVSLFAFFLATAEVRFTWQTPRSQKCRPKFRPRREGVDNANIWTLCLQRTRNIKLKLFTCYVMFIFQDYKSL
jgi:hypothetical protein